MKKYLILFSLCFSCTPEISDIQYILAWSVFGTCEYYKEFPLVIDPDFNNDEVEQIRAGAKNWEDAIGIDLGSLPISNINCSRESSIPGCIIKSDKIIESDQRAFPNILVYMDSIIEGDFSLELVITHEIGHYIGIVHTNNEESIMYYLSQNGQIENYQISEYDINVYEQVCIYNHLN
jgi:hypothetical protein